MDKKELKSKWWYRLLQVLFSLLIVAYIIGGVVIFILGLDYYQGRVRDYHGRQEASAELRNLYQKYGELLPVIDSLVSLDARQKGERASKITTIANDGRLYINSKNHNGYHYLRPNEKDMWLDIFEKENLLKALPVIDSEPKGLTTMIFRWILAALLYLLIGFIILWLIRRIFVYIATGEKFFKP